MSAQLIYEDEGLRCGSSGGARETITIIDYLVSPTLKREESNATTESEWDGMG
jgi:hypothetical protein